MKLVCYPNGNTWGDQPRNYDFVASDFESKKPESVKAELSGLVYPIIDHIWNCIGEAIAQRKGRDAFVCTITLKLRDIPDGLKADFNPGPPPVELLDDGGSKKHP